MKAGLPDLRGFPAPPAGMTWPEFLRLVDEVKEMEKAEALLRALGPNAARFVYGEPQRLPPPAFRVEEVVQPAPAAPAPAAAKAKPGRKPSAAPARLEEIVAALEEYAAATGQHFDRMAMPGPLGDDAGDEGSFHWLCSEIDPTLFCRAPRTFEKQRAGICAVAAYAAETDFYRLALPRIYPKLNPMANVLSLPTKRHKVV